MKISEKFTSLNQIKVYTHIEENIREGVWTSNWIEFDEIKSKYLIKRTTAARCVRELVLLGIITKLSKGVYKINRETEAPVQEKIFE